MRAFFWPTVRRGLTVGLALTAALIVACGDSGGADSGKVKAVTTLPLFADFVREVGGERVEVTPLIPSGTDPHTFEPSPSDVKRVAEADIAFANGLGLEPSAARLIEANLRAGAPLVKLGEEALKESGGSGGTTDPHLWMDPDMARLYAASIDFWLARVDIDGAEEYQAGYSRFVSAVDVAQSYVESRVAGIPARNRKIVTTHGAFGHFADAFGLEVVAVVVGSPGQEPSPEDVAHLTDAIRDNDVPAVFREPQLDSEGRVLEQAAKDAGVQVCVLYSDSLDDRVTSYVELLRFNGDEIARCLGGEANG